MFSLLAHRLPALEVSFLLTANGGSAEACPPLRMEGLPAVGGAESVSDLFYTSAFSAFSAVNKICEFLCALASLWPILSFAHYLSTPKVKKCKKMVQKRYILVHFCSKRAHF